MASPPDPIQTSQSLIEQLSGWSNLAATLVALVSLGVSIMAFRRAGPKIQVSLTTPFNVANGRAATFVRVTNNGSAESQIQSVRLVSKLGVATPASIHGSPKLPCTLPAHGGSQTWGFDRQDLRTIAASHAVALQTEFRAVVTSGRRNYRGKDAEVVHGGEPTQTPRRTPPSAKRFSGWLRGWTTPRVQIVNAHPVDSVDVQAQTYVLWVRNFGGGLVRGASLVLIKESSNRSGRESAAHQQPIRLPSIRRHQTRSVTVPMQMEKGLAWTIRLRDGLLTNVSVSALTLDEARAARSQSREFKQ